MPAQILELITGSDTPLLVRDQVAAILCVELANQVALAEAASKDPTPWMASVYAERTNPWEVFLEVDENERPAYQPPVVNVWLSSTSILGTASAVDPRDATSIINVDCFGYAVAKETIDGHESADAAAAREAHRALHLCRRILFSGQYTYLGSPRKEAQWIFGRKLTQLETFQADAAAKPAAKVIGARMAIEVRHSLHQPQVQGSPLETITLEVKRAGDGKVIANATYGVAPE